MSRARSVCASLVALIAAACAEEPPTAVSVDAVDPPGDVQLVVPSLTPADLVSQGADPDSVTVGPAAALYADEEAPYPDPSYSDADITPYLDEVGAIYDERTKVGFGDGFGFSYAEHRYQGNKGRVETTVRVSYQDQLLGTQSAASEKYDMFLLDAGAVHWISTTARFYTDRTCGLSVTGSSQHLAWWEWFLGGAAASWGRVVKSSSASPVYQGDCAPPVVYGSGGTSDSTCYYWIEYDLYSGEVLDVELLYCEAGG